MSDINFEVELAKMEARVNEIEAQAAAKKAEFEAAVKERDEAMAKIAAFEKEKADAFEAEAVSWFEALSAKHAGNDKFAPVSKEKWVALYKADKDMAVFAAEAAGVKPKVEGEEQTEGRPGEADEMTPGALNAYKWITG